MTRSPSRTSSTKELHPIPLANWTYQRYAYVVMMATIQASIRSSTDVAGTYPNTYQDTEVHSSRHAAV